MINLHRLSCHATEGARRMARWLVGALTAHRHRMTAHPEYRAAVLSVLEAIAQAFGGRLRPVGLAAVRLYGAA